LEDSNIIFKLYQHANRFKCDPTRMQLFNESSDSISHRNSGRKQLSQIFKLEQWKFYSSWSAMSGKPHNVGVYCVHRKIKFLIEPLRRVQATFDPLPRLLGVFASKCL